MGERRSEHLLGSESIARGGHPARAWVGEYQAVRAIKKGEPLCATYLGSDQLRKPHEERRRLLLENMGFTCSCPRCEREAAPSSLCNASEFNCHGQDIVVECDADSEARIAWADRLTF